jgi:hypothetical protein
MNADEKQTEGQLRGHRRSSVALVVLGLVPGALIGGGVVWLGLHDHEHGTPAASVVAPAPSVVKKKPLYQCPMHPSITSDHPGDCPICGMKLVEVDQKQAEPKHDERPAVKGLAEVTIDPTR